MAAEETPRIHGWLLGVQLLEGMDPSALSLRFADVIAPFGEASVEYLGIVQIGPEVVTESDVKLN